MLRICPAFCLRDTNMYLVFSVFASRPFPLVVIDKDFVFMTNIFCYIEGET
jgi:hypothetical protein